MLLFEGPTPDPRGHGRRHMLKGFLAQCAVDITIHDVSATEPTLCALYGAPFPLVGLIRPDGHLAYSGVPKNLDQLRTYLDRIYLRYAAASDRTDGGSERN